MSETKMSDIIKASMEGIRAFTDNDTVLGNSVTTPQGVTIIPVSKITIGLATGGLDYGAKKLSSSQSFGGGGGTGISITPLAFITVDCSAKVDLIQLNGKESEIDKIGSLVEKSPEIIEKIKAAFS